MLVGHIKALILAPLRDRRAFFLVHAMYCALLLGGALYAAVNPQYIDDVNELSDARTANDPCRAVLDRAEEEHEFLRYAALIFYHNFVHIHIGEIAIPSLLLPFSGILVRLGTVFPDGTNITFALSHLAGNPPLFLRLLFLQVLFLEEESTALAFLASFILGRSLLFPRSLGTSSHIHGYQSGLVASARIYTLVALLLAVGAIIEVWGILYVWPALMQ